MKIELGKSVRTLKVDGGACQNNFLMQFQADLLGCKIVRPKVIESTALGAAQLAGVTIGLWKGKKDLNKQQKAGRIFTPKMQIKKRRELYEGWTQAIKQAQVNK